MIFLLLLGLVVVLAIVFVIVVHWRVLSKAGESGWKCLVPILGPYTFACIATNSKAVRMGVLVTEILTLVCAVLTSVLGGGLSALESQSSSDALSMLGAIASAWGVYALVSAVDWVFKCIANYLLAEAFDEDRGFGIACAMFPFFCRAFIAFDSDIEYAEPAR